VVRRALRVLVLAHEELLPPARASRYPVSKPPEWRTEFDVARALRELGHEVSLLGVADEIDVVRRAAEEFRPDVCFNLLVEFHGAAGCDQHVASYLELLRIDYTGCNPRGLVLARDKALTKTILQHHGIPVPPWTVCARGQRVRRPRELEFPLFVKALDEEASLGIARSSLVEDERALEERVAFVHESLGRDALVEQYIPGRELTVSLLGHARARVLPAWELELSKLPEGAPNVATRAVKFDPGTQKRLGVLSRRAELERATEAAIARAARAAHRLLGLSGYARIDLGRRAGSSPSCSPEDCLGSVCSRRGSADATRCPQGPCIAALAEEGLHVPLLPRSSAARPARRRLPQDRAHGNHAVSDWTRGSRVWQNTHISEIPDIRDRHLATMSTSPAEAPHASTAIEAELLEELPTFELFFKTFGFKRVHGRIWGLLVLASEPLAAKDIAHILSLSQAATSTALNELGEWGAVRSTFDSSRRCHVHSPVGNALSIVATVFRRREQVVFQQFKLTAERSLAFISKRHGERDPRVLTLRSIIATCGIGEALMQLVFSAVQSAMSDSESVLSRAVHAALKVGVGKPARWLFGAGAADGAAGIDAAQLERPGQAEQGAQEVGRRQRATSGTNGDA
jgi:D-alanine-D-alanine ligase